MPRSIVGVEGPTGGMSANTVVSFDEGETWKLVTLPLTKYWRWVANSGDGTVLISDGGVAVLSEDGGLSYRVTSLPTGAWTTCRVISGTWYLVGAKSLAVSTDRCASWVVRNVSVTPALVDWACIGGRTNALVLSSSQGWDSSGNASGPIGYYARSSDMGITWTLGSWSVKGLAWADVVYGNSVTLVVGAIANGGSPTGPYCMRSTNGGLSWTEVLLPVYDNVTRGVYIDGIFYLNNGFRSTDLGASWATSYPPWAAGTLAVTSATIVAARTSISNEIAISRDKGLTWSKRALPASLGIDFLS